MNNFLQRLLMSGIFGALFFWLIYVSHDPLFQPLFVLIVTAVIGCALWEYYQIAKTNGHRPVEAIGILGSICYLYVLYLTLGKSHLIHWPLMVLSLTLFAAFLFYFFSGISPLTNLAITLFGIVYLTVPLGALLLIDIDYGRYWMLYLLLVTKTTDIAAYIAGKRFGRHQLAPVISPKKTWEGATAGFIFGTGMSSLLHQTSPLFASDLQSLIFGALMSIFAQIGDLSESLLKRDSGVKDSNRLPGFGGILDMVDSLVFTSPLLYFFLKVVR